jgi:GR25 family glycosyltransferase involved in LPS biosynthesis
MLFVVNIQDAVARHESMRAQLAALGTPYRRVGVDLRTLARPAVDAWVREHLPELAFSRAVSSAEIGCWASHVTAWRELVATPGALACTVLEDDVVLQPGFAAAVEELCARPRFDLVFLGTSCRNVSARRFVTQGALALHRPIGTIYNTWGYVVSRAWAARFLAAAPWRIDRPIDHYTGGGRAGSLRPAAAVLRPAVVEEHPMLGPASQIEPYTFRIDRSRLVEKARRRILASRASELYYRLYRLL